MLKFTNEFTFQLDQNLYKQTDGCSMGGPFSVMLSDIHMVRTVTLLTLAFYGRYVDATYNRRRKDCHV